MLTDAMLVLLLVFYGASAFDYIPTFRFANQPRIFRKDEEVCQVCFGSFECFAMDKARCDFNNEMGTILNKFEEDDIVTTSDEAMKNVVDTKMYDLMIEESLQENFKECVPLVSSYTNCHRENLCSGCATCDCDLEGTWNCSTAQLLKPENLAIDHRVLATVMEVLKAATKARNNNQPENTRYKRSGMYPSKTGPHKYTYEEISEWMYGKDVLQKEKNKTTTAKTTKHTEIDTEPTVKIATEEPPVYLGFEEVLSEITPFRKEPTTRDYKSIEEEANESINTEQFLQMLAEEEKGNDVDPYGTINIRKALHTDSSNFMMDAGNSNKIDVNNNLVKQSLKGVQADFNKEMDKLSMSDLTNVMKRDTSNMQVSTTVPNSKTVKSKSSSNDTDDMSHKEKALQDILDPLNIMIKDKNKEIAQLINIRENLSRFLKKYSVSSVSQFENQFDDDNSLATLKLDDNIQLMNNTRRNLAYGSNVLNKFYMKLKKDLNEVVRDVVIIHNNMKPKILPNDLKLLLQAIKYVLKKNKDKLENSTNADISKRIYKKNRRHFDTSTNYLNSKNVQETMLRIFEVIDKDMPIVNALSPLSRKAKEIVKRVIKKVYVDDFTSGRTKAIDLINNLTNDLKSIGGKWQERLKNVKTSSATERLYNVQMLYFAFAQDIAKLENVLALLDFVQTRRMTGIDEHVGIGILNHINSSLAVVNNEVMHYIMNDNKEKTMKTIVKEKKRKESLLKKIKSLLTNSKNDFMTLLHKKETETDIMRKISQIRRDEVKQQKYLEIMQRWQNNPYLTSDKVKRSIREYKSHNNRMKNIIPKYLRGKVNPALSAKGKVTTRKEISKDHIRPEDKEAEDDISRNTTSTTVKSKRTSVRLNKMKRRH